MTGSRGWRGPAAWAGALAAAARHPRTTVRRAVRRARLRVSRPERLLWQHERAAPRRGGPLVAAVASRRTAAALGAAFDVVVLLPHDAAALVAAVAPDVVVVESAAAMPGEAWATLGTPAGAALGEVLHAALARGRRRAAPTVLWWTTPRGLTPDLAAVARWSEVVGSDASGAGGARDGVPGALGVVLGALAPAAGGTAGGGPALPSLAAGEPDPRSGSAGALVAEALRAGAEVAQEPDREARIDGWRGGAPRRETGRAMRVLLWGADGANHRSRLASAAEALGQAGVGPVVGPVVRGDGAGPGAVERAANARAKDGAEEVPGGDAGTRAEGPEAGPEAAAGFDAVFAAGGDPAATLALGAQCRGRLVTWGSDLLAMLDRGDRSAVDALAAASGAVLCEDEDVRSRVEHRLAVGGRTVHWTARPGAGRAERLLWMLCPAPPPALRGRRLRVLFAGADLGFIEAVAGGLARLEACEVRTARWRGIGSRVSPASVAGNAWADVVVCEWAGANAVWHARNKRPGQRLIVHLHRYEVDTPWPAAVDWAAVDQLVAVSPAWRRSLCERLDGVRPARVVAVPNPVDALAFDRTKTAGARFHLGLVGAVPKLKRLDLALDVLAEVRRRDERFCLFVKGEMPWNRPAWNRAEERAWYRHVLPRVRRDPWLRGAVAFEPYAGDVANWLRKIGTVLSTSDVESFHLAVAEGMMSRAAGVVLPWPGADAVYGEPWVVPDVGRGVERILAQADPEVWERRRQAARARVAPYELERVVEAWVRLLVEDRDPAAWAAPDGAPR